VAALTRSLALAPSPVEEEGTQVWHARSGGDKAAGAVARSALSSFTDMAKMKDTGIGRPFDFMRKHERRGISVSGC
jgi:hypothetical protein